MPTLAARECHRLDTPMSSAGYTDLRELIDYQRKFPSHTLCTSPWVEPRGLILLTPFLLRLAFARINPHFLVVLLEGGEILTGLGELSLLHTLSDVPVHEGTLGVHQIELVVETSPRLGDGGRVAQHAHGSLHLGEISAGHDGRWLVVDAHLEAGRTPVDELNGALRLDRRNRRVNVFRDNIAAVQHAAGHVLAVTRVALHHLVGWLEARVCDLGHRELLVICLLGTDHRRIRH